MFGLFVPVPLLMLHRAELDETNNDLYFSTYGRLVAQTKTGFELADLLDPEARVYVSMVPGAVSEARAFRKWQCVEVFGVWDADSELYCYRVACLRNADGFLADRGLVEMLYERSLHFCAAWSMAR